MKPRLIRNLLTLTAALGLCLTAHASPDQADTPTPDYPAPLPGSYDLPVIKHAADGPVLDIHARSRTLWEFLHGRITVLSFIYTRCGSPRACPHATGVLRDLHQASTTDPELVRRLGLVSLSFDPMFDTPEHLSRYAAWAASRPAGCPWNFLTSTSREELQPILDAYDQTVDRRDNPADPRGPWNHTLRVFLIDPDGRIRNIYSSDTLDPRLVLADIRTLIAETSTRAPANGEPIPPTRALLHHGETRTVLFRASTFAAVREIAPSPAPETGDLHLFDAPNGPGPATPAERSRIVVEIPARLLPSLGQPSPEALGRRLAGRWLLATGHIHVHHRPDRPPQARIRLTDPNALRTSP